MKKYILLFLIFSFASTLKTNAQIDTAFWFVAPEVWQGHDDRPIYLRFASFENPATITISQPANAAFPIQTINLNANDAQSINLTNWIDIIENKPVNQILNYGLYISSSSPVTAYYEEASTNNPDLLSLKGNNALGTEFYTPFQNLLNSFYSESKAGIDIVATEDNTLIEVTPTANLVGYPANTSFTINLNRGQTYSLRSASTLSNLRPSGTYISSDKPIAVSISDDSILGQTYYGGFAYDLLADQLIPVSRMGQNYIGIKGQLSADDKIYITASEDNTSIVSGTSFLANIDAGETYELSLPNSAIYFSTSKPVVALHMTGYGSEVCGAILPPIDCTGSQNVSFVRSANNTFFKLNILVKTGGEGNFSFNGNPNLINATDFSDVPNTNGEWKFASIAEPSYVQIFQNSNITNTTDFFHVGIIMGRETSSRYGYFSNFNIFSHRITSSSESYCDGEPLVLSGEVLPNVEYSWEGPNGFTASGNNFDFGSVSTSDGGLYLLSGDIGECEVRTDTLNLIVTDLDDATFSVSNFCQGSGNLVTINGLPNGNFSILNPTDGASINPNNGELSNTSVDTDYQVMYQTNGACPNSTIQTVSVFAFEDASFTVDNFCFGDNNSATITGVSGGEFSLITNPDGAIINSVSGELTNASAGNIYTIEYNTLGDINTCSNSSQQIIEIYPIPTNPNTTTSYDYCLNEPINAISIVPSDANATIQWYDDPTLSNIIVQNDSYQIPSSLGTTDVYVTETSVNNCQSNPTLISQSVYPLPNIFAGNDIAVCYGESITLNGSGGLNYDWNNGAVNNISFTPDVGTYQYIVSGDNVYNCFNQDTMKIEIYPIPTNPNTTTSYDYCLNEPINTISIIPSDANATIQWYDEPTLSNIIVQNDSYQIPSSLGTTNVYVTETSVNNCQSNPTLISQSVYPLPNIFAGNDIAVCYGESITLNGSGGLNYDWNNGAENNISFTPDVGTYQYIVNGDNVYNCFNQDTMEVIIYANPLAYAGDNSNVCGLEFQLQATDNGNTGYWSAINANISSINSETTMVTNNGFGVNTFTWVETNAFGCEQSASVNINFLEQPNVFILEDTIYGCENEIVIVEGSSSNANTYLWSSDGSGNFQNQNLPITEYLFNNEDLESQDINLFLRIQLGDCYWSDTTLLILNKTPKASVFSDEFLCYLDSSISLNLSSVSDYPVSYDLTYNNEPYTNFSNVIAGLDTIKVSGTGFYQITNLRDSFCSGKDSEEFKVILRDRPVAEFTLYPRETSITEPTIYVNDQSLFADYYEWYFGDSTDVVYGTNNSHFYEQTGTFEIMLYVENEFECIDSITKNVIINPNFELYIPNAFTPDGDSVNDTFNCKGYGIANFSISILNRWGEMVFSSNDIEEQWNGKNALNGVYAYRIDVIDMLGKLHNFEGEISLLR